MQAMTNRQWLLVSRPEEMLSEQNFQWKEVPVPLPKPGEFLIRNLWLSFDPAQLGWMKTDSYIPKVPLGEPMRAMGVGQVIDSRNPDFKAGEMVSGSFGWQDYVLTNGNRPTQVQKVPPRVPPSLALSLFGITGMSAYFGVTEIGRVQAG